MVETLLKLGVMTEILGSSTIPRGGRAVILVIVTGIRGQERDFHELPQQ